MHAMDDGRGCDRCRKGRRAEHVAKTPAKKGAESELAGRTAQRKGCRCEATNLVYPMPFGRMAGMYDHANCSSVAPEDTKDASAIASRRHHPGVGRCVLCGR